MSMRLTARQRIAISAATALAEEHGAIVGETRLLRDSSFVTVQLSPTLLARVLIKGDNTRSLARVKRELSVLRFLSERGAPVVSPSKEIDAGPHEQKRSIVTFWTFEKQIVRSASEQEAVRNWKICLEVLSEYRSRLPSFFSDIKHCRRVLAASIALPHLSIADHEFLLSTYEILLRELSRRSITPVPIHGDCHIGNTIQTSRGILWCDFESVCRGPVEWDMACLARTEARNYYNADADLLHLLGAFRSWFVTSWCWMLYDRTAEKREGAHFHFRALREWCTQLTIGV